MRNLVTAIGNDADPKHRITANVGRGQRDTFVNNFETNDIDLGDIEKFAQQPSADHRMRPRAASSLRTSWPSAVRPSPAPTRATSTRTPRRHPRPQRIPRRACQGLRSPPR